MPKMAMNLFISIGILFFIIGIAIKYYRCYWLISGYNIMSKEKKQNVDIEGLGNFMGNFCFILGGIMLITAVLGYLGYNSAPLLLFSMFLIIPYMLIRGQRFDKNTVGPDGRMKGSVKFLLVVILLPMILIGGFLFYGSKAPTIEVNQEYVHVSGIYGVRVYMEEIEEVHLLETKPEVSRKVNGFDLGNILKGRFAVDGLGVGTLNIRYNKPPYILLQGKNRFYMMNTPIEKTTRELYEKIRKIRERY